MTASDLTANGDLLPALNRFASRTHTGLMLDLSDPESLTEVRLEDIAHALARVNRYNGTTDWPYSVASHSVYVARELEREGYGLEYVRGGLLHDTAEAFLGDMTSGLKRLFPDYRILEGRWEERLERAFGLRFENDPKLKRVIKEADLRARLAEARDLFKEYPYPRELLHGGEAGREPYATRVVPQSADEAEWSFLAEARRLGLWSGQ